jgi:hypothetical protein
MGILRNWLRTPTHCATPTTGTQVANKDYVDTVGGGGGGGGGSLIYLGEVIAAAAASADFTSLISATYDIYDLTWEALVPGTNNVAAGVQLSADNGATWIATNYASGGNNLGITTNFSNYLNGPGASRFSFLAGNLGTAQKSFGTTRFYGANVSEPKVAVSTGAVCASDGNVYGTLTVARLSTSTTFNAMRVIMGSGTVTGRFRLYGLKKA